MAYLGHFPAGHPDHPPTNPTIIIMPKKSEKQKENLLKPAIAKILKVGRNNNSLKTF
jgi:hypothetical protein